MSDRLPREARKHISVFQREEVILQLSAQEQFKRLKSLFADIEKAIARIPQEKSQFHFEYAFLVLHVTGEEIEPVNGKWVTNAQGGKTNYNLVEGIKQADILLKKLQDHLLSLQNK